ncbi:hypothetical protein ZEAMMB73_Zm00001d036669 [Zea mays]|uniref:Uncharacterized protein n=1 Tax=Zea mays TaxID=4577 RepID=A0A1D6LQD1_MAIZE|nr:hypothetical protein ZEAMMB73_Zm00001d036669 [Zea mays]
MGMVLDASAAGGRKVELDGDMRWTSQVGPSSDPSQTLARFAHHSSVLLHLDFLLSIQGMNEAAHGGQNRRRNESQGETNMRERRR